MLYILVISEGFDMSGELEVLASKTLSQDKSREHTPVISRSIYTRATYNLRRE